MDSRCIVFMYALLICGPGREVHTPSGASQVD
jgi:hypothetical protein